MKNERANDHTPWWRFGHVWMVISGPAIVVVAAFVTLYLALTSPNEIVSDHDIESAHVTQAGPGSATMDAGMAPAMMARNHAQTGVVPVRK